MSKRGSEHGLASEFSSRPYWHRSWRGTRARISKFQWQLFGLLAYFGHVFGCSRWGLYATRLTLFSSFLARPSAIFAKRIRELARDKAESESVHATTKTCDITASFFQTPFKSQTSVLQKMGGGTHPPGGGFNLDKYFASLGIFLLEL